MNFRLVVKLLGMICLLIGVTMLFCLPWAFPFVGHHTDSIVPQNELKFEGRGFAALLLSFIISITAGTILYCCGRKAKGQIFLREAMAIVGLSWVLATILGSLPFLLSKTYRSCSVRVFEQNNVVFVSKFNWNYFDEWYPVELTSSQRLLIGLLADPPSEKFPRRAEGLEIKDLVDLSQFSQTKVQQTIDELFQNKAIASVLLKPTAEQSPFGSNGRFRLKWVRMGVVDSLFEAQSGFSTTGATVISHLEDPGLVPHCILFWRSVTQFLGGLGIIVLFVVVLEEGSAGKALMRNEVPGPIDSNPMTRMRHMAIMFAGVYLALNAVLAIILMMSGEMNAFDAISHSFATLATGGFSNYDDSIGHFQSSFVHYTIILFMILAGTNFTLLFLFVRGRPNAMLGDFEWRTYIFLIGGLTAVLMFFGMWLGDVGFGSTSTAFRDTLFQVVSIITTTGFGTNDFDQWNSFARASLLLLMFVGGCAGSTGGGMKVIRHVLFVKILRIEIEKSFRPRVVRKLQLGDRKVGDPELIQKILVYFALIIVIFCMGWLYVVAFEPADTWGADSENKLLDGASAVVATLNNIGPGLGTVGASENYGHFTNSSKFMFIWLMMLGRLELFVVLVLFIPRFWRGYY